MSEEPTTLDIPPEEIRVQMDQTKADLAEKLAELESHVAETIQTTGTAIDSTMSSIRGAVGDVKESLNLRRQIQQHPWFALGGSLAVGMLAQALIAKVSRPAKATNVRLLNPIPDGYQAPPSTLSSTLHTVIQQAAIQSLPIVLNLLAQHWTAPRDSSEPPPEPSPDRETVPMTGLDALYNTSPVNRSAV